jgi:hypothetical protein
MRIRYSCCVLAILIVGTSTASSVALEKAPVRADVERDGWISRGTDTISYWNVCTGWAWVWSGWEPEARLGVVFDLAPLPVSLYQSWWFFGTGAPSGYGFTGTIGIHSVDAQGCPSVAALASQPFLPEDGWNHNVWNGLPVPSRFAVLGAFGPGEANPATPWSDRPAAGPTGPDACGNCYPTTRVTHSFRFGTVGSPLCPGSTFYDGVCDAELMLDADIRIEGVSVEEASWGSVKALYR